MEDLIDTLTDLQQRVSATIEEVVRRARLRTASDAELADAVARAGGIARSVDALLVESVGELADRSRSVDRAERLTTRMGCRDVGELIQRLIRCSSHTARQLGSAQRAVAPEWDPISGEARPAMLPAMRAALLRGDVGVDGVLAAAGPLLAMRDRVDRGRLMLADEAVAAQARGDGADGAPPACADLLRVHAQVWALMLDEDGAEPTDRQRAARRGLTLGRPRDGMTPIRGELLPEVAAQLRRIFDAMGSPRASGVRFRAEGDEAVVQDADAADGRFLDDRSRPQRQHDALATALAAAAASRDLPTIGGAAPTLVVSVREEDLAGSRGWARAEGADDPVSLAAARHTGCAGVVQRVSRDARGRIRPRGSTGRADGGRSRPRARGCSTSSAGGRECAWLATCLRPEERRQLPAPAREVYPASMTDVPHAVAPAREQGSARRTVIPGWGTAVIAIGALIALVGAFAALAARSSAELAAYGASQPTRLISDPSNPIALEFDRSSAHHVSPDYSSFWIWVGVAALGLIIVVTGTLIARRTRATAASAA